MGTLQDLANAQVAAMGSPENETEDNVYLSQHLKDAEFRAKEATPDDTPVDMDFLNSLSGQGDAIDQDFLNSLEPKMTDFDPPVDDNKLLRARNIQWEREDIDRKSRGLYLEKHGTDPGERLETSREEELLLKGVETEGPSLMGARTRASFTTNPTKMIEQGLAEEYPEADPKEFNVRYIQTGTDEVLTKNLDNIFTLVSQEANKQIEERVEGGEELSAADKNKITSRLLQDNIFRVPGLEMIYDNPETGQATAVNPPGMDIGDVTDMAGGALPFVGEVAGATAGTIWGAKHGWGSAMGAAGLFGGMGRGLGETMRLGFGRTMGWEPTEEEFIDPVVSEAQHGAIYSALGAGVSATIANRLAVLLTKGKISIGMAHFGNFLDPVTFAKNKAAVKTYNAMAKERGFKPITPTAGQMFGSKALQKIEANLVNDYKGPIGKAHIENGKLLDDVAGSFNKGGIITSKVDMTTTRIANEMEKRIRAKEAKIDRRLNESEAREVASQVQNILRSEMNLKDSFAAGALREMGEKAEKQIFGKEGFGRRYKAIDDEAGHVKGEPSETRAMGKKLQAEERALAFRVSSGEATSSVNNAADAGTAEEIVKYFIQDKAGNVILNPVIPKNLTTFTGMDKTASKLKALLRKINSMDAGLGAREIGLLISAIEKDIEATLKKHGLNDVLKDVQTLRTDFAAARQLSDRSIGLLIKKDKSGNWTTVNEDVFNKIILDPAGAFGIKAMLTKTGQADQISIFRRGIRHLYSQKFLPEGAAPNQLKGAAKQWFNTNKDALKHYFTPEELKAFQHPAQVAAREGKYRASFDVLKKKLRTGLQADLSMTSQTPQEFMNIIFNKGTASSMRQIKALLSPDRFTEFKSLFSGELFSKIRDSASKQGFNEEKMFSIMAIGPNPSSSESIKRAMIQQVLGPKETGDLVAFAKMLKILNDKATSGAAESFSSKVATQIVRFFVKPLSQTSRRVKAVISTGKLNIENSMEIALADPILLEKMIASVRSFQNDTKLQTALQAFVSAIGPEVLDKNNELEAQLKKLQEEE